MFPPCIGPREGCPLSVLSLLCCVTAVAARRSAPSDRARRLHMLHKGGRPRPVLEHMLQPLRALPNGLTLILGPPRSHILGPGLCRLAGRHFFALRMLTLGVLCLLKRSRRPLDHVLPPQSFDGNKALWSLQMLGPRGRWARFPTSRPAFKDVVSPPPRASRPTTDGRSSRSVRSFQGAPPPQARPICLVCLAPMPESCIPAPALISLLPARRPPCSVS